MKQPKFSVIVPVYKAESHLYRCVDNILAQSFTDFELILVNDGSPDRSGEICEEYAKKDMRIKVLHKDNGGPSSARNVGLDNAIGEYICFVDSDDTIDTTFLENFGACEADITIQGFYSKRYKELHEEYQPIIETICNRADVKHLVDILHKANNTGYLWTRAFKRKIIEANGLRLNERYRVREDEEFIWRYMCECTSFKSVNKGAYHYDMPNFDEKYNIDWDNDFRCTSSIIESTIKLTANFNHPIQINNINRLARDIIKYYLCDKFESKRIISLVDIYCNYVNNGRLYSKLNKRSRILYLCIGTRTPILIHSVISKLLKFIYRLKNL